MPDLALWQFGSLAVWQFGTLAFFSVSIWRANYVYKHDVRLTHSFKSNRRGIFFQQVMASNQGARGSLWLAGRETFSSCAGSSGLSAHWIA